MSLRKRRTSAGNDSESARKKSRESSYLTEFLNFTKQKSRIEEDASPGRSSRYRSDNEKLLSEEKDTRRRSTRSGTPKTDLSPTVPSPGKKSSTTPTVVSIKPTLSVSGHSHATGQSRRKSSARMAARDDSSASDYGPNRRKSRRRSVSDSSLGARRIVPPSVDTSRGHATYQPDVESISPASIRSMQFNALNQGQTQDHEPTDPTTAGTKEPLEGDVPPGPEHIQIVNQPQEEVASSGEEADVSENDDNDNELAPNTQDKSKQNLPATESVVIPDTQPDGDYQGDPDPVDYNAGETNDGSVETGHHSDNENNANDGRNNVTETREKQSTTINRSRVVHFDNTFIQSVTPSYDLINTPAIPKSGPSQIRKGRKLQTHSAEDGTPASGNRAPTDTASPEPSTSPESTTSNSNVRKKTQREPIGEPRFVTLWQGEDGIKRSMKDVGPLDIFLNTFEEVTWEYREQIADPVSRKAVGILASKTQKELRSVIENQTKVKRLDKSIRAAERHLKKKQDELIFLKKARRDIRNDLTEYEVERKEIDKIKRLERLDKYCAKFGALNKELRRRGSMSKRKSSSGDERLSLL